MKDNSHGFWRRVRLIPFDATFPKGDPRRDPDLKDKLRAELPGILNWCLTGLSQWRIKGLDEPERVTGATAEYRDSENVVKQFCDDRTRRIPGHAVPLAKLHEEYIDWSKKNAEKTLSSKALGKELEALGYPKYHGRLGRMIQDIALAATEED